MLLPPEYKFTELERQSKFLKEFNYEATCSVEDKLASTHPLLSGLSPSSDLPPQPLDYSLYEEFYYIMLDY
jgi:hypothetical protein